MSSFWATPAPPSDADAQKARAQTPLNQQPGPKLFFAGLLFATVSALSTRRALARRRMQFPESPTLAHTPHAPTPPAIQARQAASESVLSKGQTAAPGYQSAAAESGQAASHSVPNAASTEGMHPAVAELRNNSTMLALEAFSLATINVTSWGMVAAGGALWNWDIRNFDELRQKVRGEKGGEGAASSEKQVEQGLEELVVGVLARKEDQDKVREMLKNQRDRER